MDDLTKLMLMDPMFIQAMKDLEDRGYIKVKGNEGIEIVDKEGLQKYYDNFGIAPDHLPKVDEDE